MTGGSDFQPLTPVRRDGPSFSWRNKVRRALWKVCWFVLARPTPPPMHAWRRLLLRTFGAQVGRGVRVYSTCRIWHPANLILGDFVVLGPWVNCYNQGLITIRDRAVISQNSTLCASTHDVNDPLFQLLLRPIEIGCDAWIAAEAFVGPGVKVGDGAVLGARGVASRELEPWTIYSGNPSEPLRARRRFDSNHCNA
jgi:putative colanic acid biosynthesis acetyltransferase WcaF